MDTVAFAVTARDALQRHTTAQQCGAIVVLARQLRQVALGVRAGQLTGSYVLQNEAIVRFAKLGHCCWVARFTW
jgi:hypothetical protein